MRKAIQLLKGRQSTQFFRCFQEYYSKIEDGKSYIKMKKRSWKENLRIITYKAVKSHKEIGWIVYNPSQSMIEEILLKKEWRNKDLEKEIMDVLIKEEHLVAIEVLKKEKRKYEWLLACGFRPTRSYTRDGISFVKMDLSTSVLLRKEGLKPIKIYRKKEKVAIEKIPRTQTDEEIKKGLIHLIDKLGGIEKFVKPNQTVVIKPNIVSDHGLQGGVWRGGIVTDLRLVKAMVEILLPRASRIIIAEGSSINRSKTGKMFSHYGYDRLCSLYPEKLSLVDLNTDEVIEKPVPRGKRMLTRKIPLTLEKSDVIINMPVMKIHFAAIASLCIKSLQGAVPPLEKYMSHFFGLWQNLVNIHHLVKPHLHIIDGLTGQEDFGPISGTPKAMNLLIGGANPVAVDTTTMRIMSLDPQNSPPVLLAYLQGLGPIEEEKITILGPSIEEIQSPFKQPEINLNSGKDFKIHNGNACPGCRGYLHFVLNKLRRLDPEDNSRLLIDRPFKQKVHVFLGPETDEPIDEKATNIFVGMCQSHHGGSGNHLPGCPPHAEVMMKGIFNLFPDIERPKYADKTEEEKLGTMLEEILSME